MHKDLSLDTRLTRCLDFLNHIAKSPAISWIWRTGDKNYLAELINNDLDMQDQILGWAEKNQLIQSNHDKVKIVDKAAELRKSREEEKRKIELENTLKQIRVKISNRLQSHYMNSSESDPHRTALHHVASLDNPGKADFQKVISLIKNGASLEARDQSGETPLISAAIAGNSMMTLILLSLGAKVSVIDQDGYMPKFYKQFYTCDHEYDDGGCIPLKRYMDNPMRSLLAKIEGLEKLHLSDGTKFYSLEQIKADLLSIIHDQEFQNTKPLAALCGFVFNHVDESEQKAVCQFFMDNCKVDISKEPDLLVSLNNTYGARQETAPRPVMATFLAYREQLHGNRNHPSTASSMTKDISSDITSSLRKTPQRALGSRQAFARSNWQTLITGLYGATVQMKIQ